MYPKTEIKRDRMERIPHAVGMRYIMYVMLCTRLNLCYTLSITSSYQYNLGEGHQKIVKNIIKYLRRTKNIYIFFFIYNGDELVIHGYSDTTFQLDIDDRNSHSIYVITLNSCVVRWKGYK